MMQQPFWKARYQMATAVAVGYGQKAEDVSRSLHVAVFYAFLDRTS
jgi:hypothetical protein